jgi:proteic killer suppression protein
MDWLAEPVVPPKYGDKRTESFAAGERVKEFQAFKEQAERRLDILETAVSRSDLMLLPSNRFEALGGDREGQFSIRINQQWCVFFECRRKVTVFQHRDLRLSFVRRRLWRAIQSIPADFWPTNSKPWA